MAFRLSKKKVTVLALLLGVLVTRFLALKPEFKTGDQIKITTQVLSEPVRFETSQYLRLHGLKIYLPLYPEVSYGDKVIVSGEVQGDKLVNPVLEKVERGKLFLFPLRSRIIAFYKATLPEPHASLIAGVALGSKEAIPEGFWTDLKASGTAHVVVASGMNVTLVGGFLLNTLSGLVKRKQALVIAITGVWLYVLLAGLDAPLIRAGIMGTIAFLAQGTGRLSKPITALLLTGYLMLLLNPKIAGDLGFTLSFVATLSLIVFNAKVSRLIRFIPQFPREDLATTLAAQIGVAPILWFAFGQFNLFSPLINAAVLWTIPLTTVLGLTAGLVSLVLPGIARLLLWLVYPLTWWFTFVVGGVS